MDVAALQGRIAGTLGRGLLRLPERVQLLLGAPAPEGAPDLAPEALLLARVATRVEPAPPSDPRAVASAAARSAFTARARAIGGATGFRGRVEERTLAGRPARLYVPAGTAEPSALLLFFHGGGWVRGDLDSHDGPSRRLARLAKTRVLSFDYRLAPEHVFPAAADDAEAAWAALAAEPAAFGADPRRLAVGGDSAGGNLAAVVAQAARRAGGTQPALQLLVYPAVDLSRKRASMRLYSAGWLLSEADTDRYKRLYVPDEARWSDPRASPLLAEDVGGVAPALVVTAAADPLRDEGEAYAQRLREAGVEVELHRHPHIHGFLNMTGARAAEDGLEITAAALRRI